MRASNRRRASAFRPTVECVDDVREPNEISGYVHCAMCLRELRLHDLPAGDSPATFARVNVGLTARGVQAWCVRHNVNIAHFVFRAPAGDS